MKKSFKNEVIKREFFEHLKEVRRMNEGTIRFHALAITAWQNCLGNKDFACFGREQVLEFKKWLGDRKNSKGKPLKMRYQYEMLRKLRLFFDWLSKHSRYESKVNPTALAYLSLSRTDTAIALQINKRRIPQLEEVIKVIESIDVQNEEDQRDRALICYALLTGARVSAIYSLPMKAFDPVRLVVDQNPQFGVKTKSSKHIVTALFPIDYEPAFEHLLDWYRNLEEKGFKPDDPVFPQVPVENSEKKTSFHSTHEVKPIFWSRSAPIRKIFQKRFLYAEVPYYHPHTFRHLVVTEFSKIGLTEEEKKAISQNLGHAHTLTTFVAYGHGRIEEERQIEIIRNIKMGNKNVEGRWLLSESDRNILVKALEIVKKIS